ncbi:hypothetical protein PMIN06_004338 [Paraphaeosphaeria minitans]|uniref:Uncharacterized protein n=1 Tax=Paraphaeosphaeria minitans TaxID=565426 RepID=A0A9P6GA43_9PLEO|nr:hypothetical protein PMIN01_10641 [Paraphaeosphaeria minitans]
MMLLAFLTFFTLTTALSLHLRHDDGVKFCPPSCVDMFNTCKLAPSACADEVCGVLDPGKEKIWRPSSCRSCNFCQGRIDGSRGDVAAVDHVSVDDAAVDDAAKVARGVE